MDSIFFQELTRNLALITKVKYILISRTEGIKSPEIIETVAFWSNGEFVENINYDINGTPCEDVLKGNTRFYPERVQELFPEDKELIAMDAEGYLGCPILSSSGHVYGHISIIDTISLCNEKELTAIVQAFAALASSEFDRMEKDQALIRSEENFSNILRVSPGAIVITRHSDGKIIDANDACIKLSGYQREELIGKTTIELNIYGVKDREKVISVLKSEGDYADFESILRRKDGYILNTLSSAVVLKVNGEQCIFTTIHDITERIKVEKALKESEEKFRSAFDYAPTGMVILDNQGDVIKVNEALCEMFGYEESEFVGNNFLSLTTDEEKEESKSNFNNLISGNIKSIKIEKHYIHKNGHLIDVILSASAINDVNGIPHNLIVQLDDITLQKNAEIKLQESENRFRALYDANPAMFFTVNRDSSIDSVNEFGAEKLGYRVDELIGRPAVEIALAGDREDYKSNIESCFLDKENTHNWEIRKLKSNGSIIWGRESARVIDDIDGKQKLLIVSEDITEAHKLSQQLSYQASHDELTGLVNRREFEIRLERLINDNQEFGEENAFCYMDLDQFKVINDTCGHLAGDELLRQLGALFKSKIRKNDTLARLGGDEFGVLMENCSLSQARRVANNLRKLVEEFQFVWIDKRFSIGVSIGLVPINDNTGSVADILSAADAACYAAKDTGRNRVHVYYTKDLDLATHRGEMQWVSKINHALEDERFRLYVQPIVPLQEKSDEGKHYECLIRMVNEDGGVILPGAFLPAAERYDLSTKIDRWVFESIYAWLAKQSGKRKKLISCSVNLSGHSLSNEEFLHFVINKLAEGKVLPSNFCFEVTETVAISRLSNAIRFMEVLKDKGCFFALDDFGSGVSSFGYLKSLPVDFLKIDGMFIRDMLSDPIDLEMVRSINEIGHVMEKKTIAECVENKEIVQCLKELGVDYAQGYYMGKPRLIKVSGLKSKPTPKNSKKSKKKNKKRTVRTRRTD